MNRQILRLAIPNILSNISLPLLSTVDTVLMGNLSPRHLGAIGLGAMIFNFVYWNFGFLRMGTTGLTAQAVGRQCDTEMTSILMRSLGLALLISMVIIGLRGPLIEMAIYLMQTMDSQADLVRQYLMIRIWAAPATLGLYVMFGWFFGLQNAWMPLVITILVNLINITLSYLFVIHYGLEIRGVALGTVIAQYIGFLVAGIWAVKKYTRLFLTIHLVFKSFQSEIWLSFLKLNRDIFLRTLCLTLVFAFFYSQSSAGGVELLAVNVVLLQLLNWMSYGIDGFAFAAESLTGKYYGADHPDKLDLAIKSIFKWSVGFAMLYSLVYGFLYKPIFSLFTKDIGIIDLALDYRVWMIFLPLLGFASYIWDGIFVGITAARAMRNSMFVSCIIFIASFVIIQQVAGLQMALWSSLSLFLVVRALLQWFMYARQGAQLK